jgi:hypothetical protein
MSLINDALKKAQRQRTPDAGARPAASEPTPSSQPAPQPYTYVRPARASGPDPSLVKLGAIGGGVLIAILAGVLIWKMSGPGDPDKPETSTQTATVSSRPTETPVVQPPGSSPQAQVPVVTPPPSPAVFATPQFTIRSEPPATGSTTAPTANPPIVTPPATAPAVTTATEAPKVSAAKPDPRVLVAIDGFKILGVRIGTAGKESKVLMNDRVYRLNDYVLPELGLKLTGVTSSTLTFEDSNGALYTKSF